MNATASVREGKEMQNPEGESRRTSQKEPCGKAVPLYMALKYVTQVSL